MAEDQKPAPKVLTGGFMPHAAFGAACPNVPKSAPAPMAAVPAHPPMTLKK